MCCDSALIRALPSEDDGAMEVDSGTRKKQNTEDLSEYKLEEYDDDGKTSGLTIYCRTALKLLI